MTRKDALWMAGVAAGGVLMGAALAAETRRARRAIELDGRAALVTGGSRGLGLLIARELGRHGASVVLMARDQAELDRAERKLRGEGFDVSTIAGDVSVPGDARRAVETVVERHGSIDVLVNNAGIITVGPVEHATLQDYEESMAVHFWGPLHTMQAAIPHMRNQGGGRIANISSFGGKIGVPHMVPYCAGKFALAGLSGALTPELARDNIAVTTVCPGLMRTGSPFNAWFRWQHREEFAWFAIADSLPLISTSGRDAAEQIVEAVRHGDAELVITWAAKLAVVAAALMPNTVALALQAANALLPGPAPSSGGERWTGWQSMSDWAPSKLTRLAEQAALENNEMRR
ncbi:MAG TPA: SDR family oxidoreductase [Vicinamibacterales bacterium]|nr:SDR family oxidoreductase [Vicinamibacterales bacterium]